MYMSLSCCVRGDLSGMFTGAVCQIVCLNQVGGAKHGGRQEQVELAKREYEVW